MNLREVSSSSLILIDIILIYITIWYPTNHWYDIRMWYIHTHTKISTHWYFIFSIYWEQSSQQLPPGKLTVCHFQFTQKKMVIFNSYVKLPEGMHYYPTNYTSYIMYIYICIIFMVVSPTIYEWIWVNMVYQLYYTNYPRCIIISIIPIIFIISYIYIYNILPPTISYTIYITSIYHLYHIYITSISHLPNHH